MMTLLLLMAFCVVTVKLIERSRNRMMPMPTTTLQEKIMAEKVTLYSNDGKQIATWITDGEDITIEGGDCNFTTDKGKQVNTGGGIVIVEEV